ncbi:MAG: PDZ domain-containing protein [Acidobacteriota bacterium]
MRRLHRLAAACSLLVFVVGAGSVAAIDIEDTRLLNEPAISGAHVAFVYADDLWIADRAEGAERGVRARRLTSHPGIETAPRFSPDGKLLAFSGAYDGNVDVFVVPVTGGEPRRLTWHPGSDEVLGFTPDGSQVLFRSQRASHTRRYHQLFTVPVSGGFPDQLPIPHAFRASYSPDGSKIAYVPAREAFEQWKHYRGGTTSRIWIYDVVDHSVDEIPQPAGRANDTDPMWIGERVFFRSDRNGEFNLFAFDPADRSVTQLTEHSDFPIIRASAEAGGQGPIIYAQAGYLHLYEPDRAAHRKLTLGVAADVIETRPRYVKGWDHVRFIDISPSASRVVMGFRGEIVTVPAKKGDPRVLTDTPGTHERYPVWSPDGRSIAYFSDASGEYQLHVVDADDPEAKRAYELGGAGFYSDPKWSPDSKKLSYVDNSRTIFWIELESGEVTKVSSDVMYGPVPRLSHSWSPDSRWLAHTRNTETYFQELHLYDLENNRSTAVTEGLSDIDEPVFDRSGKYLYFLASTDAGPVRTWFAQSNADMELTHNLYLAVLQKGVPSPLAKESDEEQVKDTRVEDAAEGDEAAGDGEKAAKGADEGDAPRVEIDFDGLGQRILTVPVPTASMRSLRAGAEGQIYFLETDMPARSFGAAPGSLQHYDLHQREKHTLLAGVSTFVLTADGEKILAVAGERLVIGKASGTIDAGQGRVDLESVTVRIEPRAEWRQIFEEAWRLNRDFFYDPGMHGADWPAMRRKYEPFLADLTTRNDLNQLIRWMCSELAVGHHRNGGGDRLADLEELPGGLLGADYAIDQGRYRFARVFGGLNWNPSLRAPLTEPGVDVKEGEYLLAVDGEELRAPQNLFERFENRAGRLVELTVGPNPDGTDSRDVKVVPIGDEGALRNRDWVEGNLRRVTEATDGRVAYVHVPNTAAAGHAYFKRYFFPQAHKQAIIVDERYNGGGLFADYYIDILRRPLISHWAMRYGQDLKSPLASIQGPKVMLIDENAGSGGDLLPWMFRKLELGPLVGKRTWGGLVGILGFPPLMDGGFVTAPNLAFWTEEGFGVENVGVPPDVEVEQLPAEIIAGRDPQLDKAIEMMLEALEANPPKPPQRPAYPLRAKP